MYVLLVGVIWGFRFPGRCGARVLTGMSHGISDLQGLAEPAFHALRLLGVFSGLVVAYICRGLGQLKMTKRPSSARQSARLP
jgi:hypothetical protein